jgi:hypothetical protein
MGVESVEAARAIMLTPESFSRVQTEHDLAEVPQPGASEDNRLAAARVAVYQPWIPSTDEGWTRFVLERFAIPYQTVHDAEVRAGGLGRRFDTVVLPSIGPAVLRYGYSPGQTEPEYVGGLGSEGASALRQFVLAGGTLVCLEG